MSEFDFLKDFGKGLDRERPHEPADTNWEKLSLAIEAEQRRARRPRLLLVWLFPLLASVVFTMLGSMLWQTRLKADKMQVEINRLQSALNSQNNVVVTDTMVRHISVIQYDTIYRTVVIKSRGAYVFESAWNASDANFPKTQSPGSERTGQYETKKMPSGENAQPITPVSKKNDADAGGIIAQNNDNQFVVNNEKAGKQGLVEGITSIEQPLVADRVLQKNELALLPSKGIFLPQSQRRKRLPNAFDIAMEVPAPAAPRTPLIRRLGPHNVALGITGGLLFPNIEEAKTNGNYTYGLNGQVDFGRHLRAFAGLERGRTNFTVRGTALDNSNIPAINAPTPNDVLENVEVKQPLWDISLGIRYVFAPEKRWRLLAGAAWLGERTLEQTLKYEFSNQLTNEETYILVPRNNARFNANGFQLEMGTEWSFRKQVSLGLGGIYQRQYGTSVPLLAERWGVKAEVAYKF